MNDIILDYSEFYDFILAEIDITGVDAVLDSSEYYDYDIGDNTTDYIYYESIITTYYILTEDGHILTTEDNYRLRYI
jgi:hypothetical protein